MAQVNGNLSVGNGALTRIGGTTGAPLINGTGALLQAQTPNDGNNHVVIIALKKVVTSTETGGVVGVAILESGGTADTSAAFAGALTAGTYHWPATAFVTALVGPNCTIYINQTSALTAGASSIVGEIWSS